MRHFDMLLSPLLGMLMVAGAAKGPDLVMNDFHPEPRADENSRIAHRQLVLKAKQGGIDLYFVGDSITRRWGTSDSAWRPMYENWVANFHGWNAGNFGWGADATRNVAWRLQNGELDGVNPKVIVLLAGTNDIGEGATPADVAKGVEAILGICRSKAPRAVIVLMAIFPRNDDMALMPVIAATNQRLRTLADGRHVRFLDLTAKLADANGRLYEGMTIDHLHLSVQGYQVWANGLRPILRQLLGPRSKTDHAPPPTGDPSATKPG